MERCIIWYVLSLKNCLKKRSSYFTVFGMVFLVWIISGISIPSSTNMKAGLLCGDSLVANQIKDTLVAEEDDFEFVEYEEEDDLIEDVVSGKIDSGFIFSEDFDEMFEERDTGEGITYYMTPFSTKGEVLKEKLFSVYFEFYSQNILKDVEETVFGNENENRMKEILETNNFYLESNEIFQIQIQQVDEERIEQSQEKDVHTVAGFVGLSVFLAMFFSYAETQLKESDHVELALNRKEQFCYRYIKMLAAAVLPSITGLVLMLYYDSSRGLFSEVIQLLIFILLSALWISIVGRLFKRAEDFPTWLLSIIVLHLLICPIVYDFAIYVPAIKWFRYLLPLGILLR